MILNLSREENNVAVPHWRAVHYRHQSKTWRQDRYTSITTYPVGVSNQNSQASVSVLYYYNSNYCRIVYWNTLQSEVVHTDEVYIMNTLMVKCEWYNEYCCDHFCLSLFTSGDCIQQ